MTHNTITHQELIRLTKTLQSGTHTPEQLIEAIQRLESAFNTVSQDCDQLTEQNKILQKQINTYQILIENLKKEQKQEIDSLKTLFQKSLNSLEQEHQQEIQSLENDLTTYKSTAIEQLKQENADLETSLSLGRKGYQLIAGLSNKQGLQYGQVRDLMNSMYSLIQQQNDLLQGELDETSKTQQLQKLQDETVSLETRLAELKADEQSLQKQLQAHKNEYQSLS